MNLSTRPVPARGKPSVGGRDRRSQTTLRGPPPLLYTAGRPVGRNIHTLSAAALGKGESQKDEIAALFKRLDELFDRRDELKKGVNRAGDKRGDAGKQAAKKDDASAATDKKGETPQTKFDTKIPTNAELAGNLKGHLLLVHGEIDNNVHPANTMRLADALIKANKRLELLIIPGCPPRLRRRAALLHRPRVGLLRRAPPGRPPDPGGHRGPGAA